jgi:hypothetical protein
MGSKKIKKFSDEGETISTIEQPTTPIKKIESRFVKLDYLKKKLEIAAGLGNDVDSSELENYIKECETQDLIWNNFKKSLNLEIEENRDQNGNGGGIKNIFYEQSSDYFDFFNTKVIDDPYNCYNETIKVDEDCMMESVLKAEKIIGRFSEYSLYYTKYLHYACLKKIKVNEIEKSLTEIKKSIYFLI